MKFLSLIFVLITNIVLAQSSNLYRKDGKLFVDTTFSIPQQSLKMADRLEKVLLPYIYNTLKYPEINREVNVEDDIIVELRLGSDAGNTDYRIAKSKTDYFTKYLLTYFKSLPDFLIEQISPQKGVLQIYIPLKFIINRNRLKETLKLNKALTIEANEVAPQSIIITH